MKIENAPAREPAHGVHTRWIAIAILSASLALGLALASGGVLAAQPWSGTGTPEASTSDDGIQAMIDQVTADRLVDLVNDLSGENEITIGSPPETHILNSRYSYTVGTAAPMIDWAAQYVLEYYQRLSISATIAPFSPSNAPWLTMPNVVAEIPGEVDPSRIIIICAHLDSRSSSLESEFDAPGADDNASGTAAVMVAAEILSHYRLANTVRFLHFSGEEQGLQGSKAYAEKARDAEENIVAVVNLDMIGWDSLDGPTMQVRALYWDEGSQTLASRFSEAVATYSLPISPTIISYTVNGDNTSDHASFWHNNFSAICLIEDTHDFNPYYHKVADEVTALNLGYFTAISKAALATVAGYAQPIVGPVPTVTPTATPTMTPQPRWRIYFPIAPVRQAEFD